MAAYLRLEVLVCRVQIALMTDEISLEGLHTLFELPRSLFHPLVSDVADSLKLLLFLTDSGLTYSLSFGQYSTK